MSGFTMPVCRLERLWPGETSVVAVRRAVIAMAAATRRSWSNVIRTSAYHAQLSPNESSGMTLAEASGSIEDRILVRSPAPVWQVSDRDPSSVCTRVTACSIPGAPSCATRLMPPSSRPRRCRVSAAAARLPLPSSAIPVAGNHRDAHREHRVGARARVSPPRRQGCRRASGIDAGSCRAAWPKRQMRAVRA